MLLLHLFTLIRYCRKIYKFFVYVYPIYMYNVPGESNISVKLYTNLKRQDSLSIPRSLEYKFCRFSSFADESLQSNLYWPDIEKKNRRWIILRALMFIPLLWLLKNGTTRELGHYVGVQKRFSFLKSHQERDTTKCI